MPADKSGTPTLIGSVNNIIKRTENLHKTFTPKKYDMILDTGADQTSMSYRHFCTLKGHDEVELKPTSTRVWSAAKDKQIICKGSVPLQFTFTTVNNVKIQILHEVYVLDDIFDPILIGDDFIQQHTALMTNTHLFFHRSGHPGFDVNTTDLPIRELHKVTHKVNISRSAPQTMHKTSMKVRRTVVLPPQRITPVPCTLEKGKASRGLRFKDVIITAHPKRPHDCAMLQMHATLDDTRHADIPIRNTSDVPIWLRPGNVVAKIQQLDPQEIVNRKVSVTPQVSKEFDQWSDRQQEIALESRLKKKDIEQELREQLREEFFATGRATLPIEGEMEKDCPSMDLKDVVSKTDDQILADIDLKHLDKDKKAQVLAVAQKNIAVFARHDLHFQKTHLLEADIELKPIKEVKMQHYRPTPLKDREEVLKILRQMQTHGLIRQCNEASPFLSQSFTIKKKDKKGVRVLLDSRLLNSSCQKLPQQTITTEEVAGKLARADWTTTLDISHAY